MPDGPTVEQQIGIVIRALEGRQLPRTSPIFKKSLEWVSHSPTSVDVVLRRRLMTSICSTFNVQESDIINILDSGEVEPSLNEEPSLPLVTPLLSEEQKLKRLLPKQGWLHHYTTYTQFTECPLSYHVFCGLAVLGASLGRRVFKSMGFFKVFPNYCVILVGPTGRVKKTIAADVAKGFIHNLALCPIMADKITPESMALALLKSGHHFIYAPEFSVFFGKQRYNEGMITQMLRLLDCPASYKISTVTRSEQEVTDIALTVVGASTLSLLAKSTPDETTSSGFLNRFVLVTENDTERCFPNPLEGPQESKDYLQRVLERMRGESGEMTWSPEANKIHEEWYFERRKLLRNLPDETSAEVMERGQIHLIRTAMNLHLADCGDYCICQRCLEVSIDLMQYVESHLPDMIRALNRSLSNQDSSYLISALRRLGGAADHSTLLRRVANRGISGSMFKQHIKTLEEMGMVRTGKKGMATYYTLVDEGGG